jgi:hypothetical protein
MFPGEMTGGGTRAVSVAQKFTNDIPGGIPPPGDVPHS